MLRMKPVADATKAEAYYAKSDGGYYLQADDLHREWGGKAAARLGLAGPPEFEHFRRLLHGLDPQTGEQLTARLDDDRIAGWDVTACVPKGVTTVIERGDTRVRGLLWEANRRAMADLEAYATTRVRKGGQQDDRVTGNLAWYSVEHAETRPTEEDNMPDWDRHIHNVIANATYDPVERQWKAVKYRPIMELRKFFDRRFDHYLSGLLAEAGYAIETKWERNDKGGVDYYSWDIQGIPQSVIAKNSRRSAEVDATEQDILADMKEKNGQAPERLSAMTRDQLGATSRRQKRDDLTLAECRAYWNRRITPEEGRQIAETIARALRGGNPRPANTAAKAVDHAMRHHFEQYSVVPFHELAITAMEHSMGGATPEAVEREAVRQGVLLRQVEGKWLATTDRLMREEDYLVGVAAGGRGKVAPVGVPPGLERGKLNDGQWDIVRSLLNSCNRVNLVEGPAGAGKSWSLQKFDEGMRRAGETVTYLATTTGAAGELAKAKFEVNTVARFLLDEKLQASARGGRVVVDEISMLGHKDAVKLFQRAEALDLKLIFVGDPLQHGAVPRGALLHILKHFAGIQPYRLTEILRQEDPAYLAAVKQLSEGHTVEGFDALDRMGWVREIGNDADRYMHLAADYLRALAEKTSVLVVSPTHAEAGKITAEIRSQLRAAGKLGSEERGFTRLVAAHASEAERGRAETYRPGDVLAFHQNAKGFTKGDRFTVGDPAEVPLSEAARFQLYRAERISLSEGDRIRFTGTVKTVGGDHTLKNGAVKTVAGFDAKGNIRLENGWVIPADSGHFRHGFVDTSFGSQGKTVQRVLLGMAAKSAPAMNQEQMYVSASRGKQRMTLYTDSKEEAREAIQRSSQKLAALDLRETPKPGLLERLKKLLERRRRRASIDRMRAAWERQGRSSPLPPRTPGPPTHRPATHRERVAEQYAERDGYGR